MKRHIKTPSVGDGFQELDRRIDYFIKYAPKQNFGDYLPELICHELLSYPRVQADVYRLIGSVIEDRWIRQDLRRVNGHLSGLIAFWCCGARGETPLSSAVREHSLFFGVRGPLTRNVLQLPADTPLGDPGLLAPIFHTPSVHAATAGKSICIPHIQDTRSLHELLALSGADVAVHPEIDAGEKPLREILDKIASADFVLTASLHGAIIACAYGRPFAFWNNGHLDVPFKWDDFAQSVGFGASFATDLKSGMKLWTEEIMPVMKIPSLRAILDVAPFSAKPAALLRAHSRDIGDLATFETAAEVLAALPSQQSLEIQRLQRISANAAAESLTIDRQVRRFAWHTAKGMKRRIDRHKRTEK